ncbi:MAG: GNAT family N-acetyltransferase [Candidatus Omnitrophica bacterium]|nr:GNAT family N-acetyltransferase [Candidatus Omnitrophota bacterium]MCM8828974.1 GNAT family N-acetyltransferase [Candidatus Omnitrophota bacterium]
MIRIENPSKKEYENIMQFLEESFDHSRGFFYRSFPQVMSKETLDYDNIFIIRQNKRIASLIGIYPQNVVLNGRETTIGGIGSVSTHPDFRNKGYMKILMDFCIEEMKRRNYSFSILGGDRQRYNFWGYETCGANAVFTFSQRAFEKTGITSTVLVSRYDGSIETLQDIKEAHEKFPCYIERTIPWYKKVFDERIHTQLYYTRIRNSFAYAVAVGERTERTIVEIGGDSNLWCSLINQLLKRWNANEISVNFPANIPETNVLLKHASRFTIGPFFMIKILSLKDTMDFLFGKDFENEYLAKITETKEIAGKGKKLVELDEKKWVRILFGPFSLDTPDFLKKKQSQFYWWFLDHI